MPVSAPTLIPAIWFRSTLTANIRQRRGAKVCILVPIFNDARASDGYGRDGPSASSAACAGPEVPFQQPRASTLQEALMPPSSQ